MSSVRCGNGLIFINPETRVRELLAIASARWSGDRHEIAEPRGRDLPWPEAQAPQDVASRQSALIRESNPMKMRPFPTQGAEPERPSLAPDSGESRKNTPACGSRLEVSDLPVLQPADRPGGHDPDDPFEDGMSFPSAKEYSRQLPKFVARADQDYREGKNPWAVRSIADLVRNYLIELSLSLMFVSISGVLAGKLVDRYFGGWSVQLVLGGYLNLFFLHVLSTYLWVKGMPSDVIGSRFQRMLLGCFLLTLPHVVAFVLLRGIG